MTAEEFNIKYADYLEDGHYGLDLHNPEAVEYLDNEFQEFIKDPDFSYSQIKSKFNSFRLVITNGKNLTFPVLNASNFVSLSFSTQFIILCSKGVISLENILIFLL